MDDLLLLSDNPNTLKQWELHISTFLSQQLKLKLHPKKRVLTKTTYGFNYLGYNVFPHYKHIRHSTILTLKHRLKYFNYLIEPDITTKTPAPERGQWQRWERWEREKTTPVLSIQLLKAMLSTINSYYGLLSHANHCRLRKHLYHHNFNYLTRFFIPKNSFYTAIKIKQNISFNKVITSKTCQPDTHEA